jgi:hypothetical protein
LQIDEVTKEASNILGENGLIRAANQHSCTQCTQKYKATSDINISADPAAVAGVDNNQTVPPMVHSNPESSTSNSVTTLNNVSELSLYSRSVLSKVLLSTVVTRFKTFPKIVFKSEFNERLKECHCEVVLS